jgi:peroxiredoxin Q/BCP
LPPKTNAFERKLPMLKARTRAPEFVLQNDQGQDTSLSDLLQDGPLVLFFYPADFTPGCTREACTIRDLHKELASVGLRVAGISPQDADSHARFRATHDLPFTLLSDPDKSVIRMYGVDGPLGFGVRRATFLIGQDRTINDAVLADIRIGRHEEFIRKAIILRETAGMHAPTGEEVARHR